MVWKFETQPKYGSCIKKLLFLYNVYSTAVFLICVLPLTIRHSSFLRVYEIEAMYLTCLYAKAVANASKYSVHLKHF